MFTAPWTTTSVRHTNKGKNASLGRAILIFKHNDDDDDDDDEDDDDGHFAKTGSGQT
jgi:hypothetical protein